jgi:ABC-type transport system involved in cytochrome c biogenesis permease subunit
MTAALRILPWFVVGLATIYLGVKALPPHSREGQMRLEEFGHLPVQEGGRIKPIDSLARNSLLMISGYRTFRDQDGKEQPAIKWLLDVMASGRDAAKQRVFHIEDKDMQSLLQLPPRPDSFYAEEEFATRLGHMLAFAKELPAEQQQSPRFRQLIELGEQVGVYENAGRYDTPYQVFRIENDQLLKVLELERREGLRYAFGEFRWKIPQIAREAERARGVADRERDAYDNAVMELFSHIRLYVGLAQRKSDTLRLIPPGGEVADWQAYPDFEARVQQAALENLRAAREQGKLNVANLDRAGAERLVQAECDRVRPQMSPAAHSLTLILRAYENAQVDPFNQAVADYRHRLAAEMPGETRHGNLEFAFNHFAPFYQCERLYIAILFFAVLAWLGWTVPVTQPGFAPLLRSVFALTVLTFAVHTGALLTRMYLQDWRPPVTNLYSSAIFIGWGAVIVCLVLELMFRNGLANVVAAALGFATMFIANFLATSGDGDTIEQMRAVLNTNFWLATHVVCVTSGYMATLVAGCLGILYVLWGLCVGAVALSAWSLERVFQRPALAEGLWDFVLLPDREFTRTLGQMIYGIICFATLLSFTGTVLGGIWADQSWGRFWGWDPKENGALLIVIWNALILHARWCGLVKGRGLALLAIAGNLLVGWSWFGTNQLGVGLHAYGFNKHLAVGLRYFWISQLGLIAVGLVPVGLWRSFAKPAQPPSPPQAPRDRR